MNRYEIVISLHSATNCFALIKFFYIPLALSLGTAAPASATHATASWPACSVFIILSGMDLIAPPANGNFWQISQSLKLSNTEASTAAAAADGLPK